MFTCCSKIYGNGLLRLGSVSPGCVSIFTTTLLRLLNTLFIPMSLMADVFGAEEAGVEVVIMTTFWLPRPVADVPPIFMTVCGWLEADANTLCGVGVDGRGCVVMMTYFCCVVPEGVTLMPREEVGNLVATGVVRRVVGADAGVDNWKIWDRGWNTHNRLTKLLF